MVLHKMQHLETRVEVVGTTRVLTKEEQKPGKMIEVIKKLASEIDFTRQPLVKLEASSLKDIKINPSNFEGTIRRKHFTGLNLDDRLGTIEEICQEKQKLSEFMNEYGNLTPMNEDSFIEKIHNTQNGFQFSYIEDFEHINSIIQT